MRKYVYTAIFIWFHFAFTFADSHIIYSATELTDNNWTAGDTIMLANGQYSNVELKFKGTGTHDNPICFVAQTPGQVQLTNGSYITVDGYYLKISGIDFMPTAQATQGAINFTSSSSHCSVMNCRVDSYNPSNLQEDFKWVNLRGTNHLVDHCTFLNKKNMGTLLVVWLTNGNAAHHQITNNYFGERLPQNDSNGNPLNGQEIIRIGDSSTSLTNAQCLVANNYFEHCNGEIECISNKSCENTYENNTFYEVAGTLTLRHGHRCIVRNNLFLANNYLYNNATAGGVRIIGEDHFVYNNYFYKVPGSDYRAAICMTNGNENTVLNRYSQVKRALVAYNTFIDCYTAMHLAYGDASDQPYAPEDCRIYNNLVCNTSNLTVVKVSKSSFDFTAANNYYSQGSFSGITESSIFTKRENLTATNNHTDIDFLVPNFSDIQVSTTPQTDIQLDICGTSRTNQDKPGCIIPSVSDNYEFALPDNTGCEWLLATQEPEIIILNSFDTDFTDSQWGVPSSSLPTSGSFPKLNLPNGFILQHAIFQEGACTCSNTENPEHSNRLSVDKVNYDSWVITPYVSTCHTFELHATTGTAGRSFAVDIQYGENDWVELFEETSSIKAQPCKIYTQNVNSSTPVRFRIRNTGTSTLYIWKIRTTPLDAPTHLKETEHTESAVNVYDLQGRLLKQNVDKKEALVGLKYGIYVVGREKIFYKP